MTDMTTILQPDLPLTIAEHGTGRPVLLLHGGGGPATIASIAEHLGETMHVIVPTHPGWNGAPRPDWLDSIDDLAMLYLRYLKRRGLHDVLVIGSSLGGWLAAQMAFRDTGGMIGRLVLIDAVGIDIPEYPMTNFFALDPRGVAEHSYHEPDRFYVDPATLPAERLAAIRGNITTLRVLAGEPYMHDPKLLRRLGEVQIPALLIWGESDRIVTPHYGAAFAAALPNAKFEIVPRAGHLPQLERPEATFAFIDAFVA